MRVSLNELETRYGRAFQALGFPDGLAADAAGIVARHDVWGLDGLAALHARLAALDGAPVVPRAVQATAAGLELDAGGASLLAVGPAALDLLAAEAGAPDGAPDGAPNGAEVRVAACEDTLFLPGLAGLAAARGQTILLRAQVGLETVTAASRGGEVALYRTADSGAVPEWSGGVVQCWGGPCVPESRAEGPVSRADGPVLSGPRATALLREALDRGVTVDPAPWQAVYRLGARLLVAEDAQSRAHGAGGADDGR